MRSIEFYQDMNDPSISKEERRVKQKSRIMNELRLLYIFSNEIYD